MKLGRKFFSKDSRIVAKKLLGKILVRKINGKIFRAEIVETEVYFGEDDPASWARFGKRKDNYVMWESPGTVLIKNVHKYKMLNFVTEEKDIPGAILIRAVKPLNFDAKCSGPGLLTEALNINKDFNEKNIFDNNDLFLESSFEKNFEICESFRIGVRNDLPEKLRFYIKDNPHVSRK